MEKPQAFLSVAGRFKHVALVGFGAWYFGGLKQTSCMIGLRLVGAILGLSAVDWELYHNRTPRVPKHRLGPSSSWTRHQTPSPKPKKLCDSQTLPQTSPSKSPTRLT